MKYPYPKTWYSTKIVNRDNNYPASYMSKFKDKLIHYTGKLSLNYMIKKFLC